MVQGENNMTIDEWFDTEPEKRSYDATTQEGPSPETAPYMKMTPLARRIAAERGIDTSSMKGSGHMGKIFTEDLSNYAPEAAPQLERPHTEAPFSQPLRPVFSIVSSQDEASAYENAPAAKAPPPPRMSYATGIEEYREAPKAPPPPRMSYASGQDEYREALNTPPPPRMAFDPRFDSRGALQGPPESPYYAPVNEYEEQPQQRPYYTPGYEYEEPPKAPPLARQPYTPEYEFVEAAGAPAPDRPDFTTRYDFGEAPKAPPPERQAFTSEYGFVETPKAPPSPRRSYFAEYDYPEYREAPKAPPEPALAPAYAPEYEYDEAPKEPQQAGKPWFPEYEYRESPKAMPPASPSHFFGYEKQDAPKEAQDAPVFDSSWRTEKKEDAEAAKPVFELKTGDIALSDERTTPLTAAAVAADEDIAGIMRMNDARRSVAVQTAKSSIETAPVTQHMETDITELVALRGHLNADRGVQDPIPMTAFYIKAMAACVREKDRFRMRLADANDAYLLIEGAHIGFQVNAGESLATPVLRDADQKPIEQVASEIHALTEKARRGNLSRRDVRGGALTLLDKGDSSVHTFTPIINLPESAILGIGAIYKRLVMTGRSIENRYFIMQSLTYDHRVINGHEADEFQGRLKEVLEDPRALLG